MCIFPVCISTALRTPEDRLLSGAPKEGFGDGFSKLEKTFLGKPY